MREWPKLILLTLFTCCGTSFEQLRNVTRVEITDNQNRPFGKITKDESIARIIAFTNARRDRWQVPFGGVPIPTLVANFYEGERFLGHFGAGLNFFECQRDGGFYSRAASEIELKEFEALVGRTRRVP